MPKRPAITTVGAFSADPTPQPETEPSSVVSMPAPKLRAVELPTKPRTTGPRAGKKAVLIWVPPGAKRQLDRMVFEMETSAQALLVEALNDLFKKYDLPGIA
jgi:hypothetical protein